MTQAFLLFDLDGTISDPLVGIARSFNYALKALGYAPRPMSDMAECVRGITRQFLEGRSYADIAAWLDGSPWRPPRGGETWDASTVAKTMANDHYAGIVSFGPLQYDGEPAYPALWDDATYQAQGMNDPQDEAHCHGDGHEQRE